MHLGGVLRSFAHLGLAKQFFWSWGTCLLCVGIGWLLTDVGQSQLG